VNWYVWKWWRLAWASPGGDFCEDAEGRWRPLCGWLWLRNGSRVHAQLQWLPAYLWLGCTWRRDWEYPQGLLDANHARIMLKFEPDPGKVRGMTPRLDVWLCLLPCLPLHLTWWGTPAEGA
jgi:hypothetical protein